MYFFFYRTVTGNTCDVMLLHCSLLKRSLTTLGICRNKRCYLRSVNRLDLIVRLKKKGRDMLSWTQDNSQKENLRSGTLVGFKAVLTFLMASSKFSSSSGTPFSFFRIPKGTQNKDKSEISLIYTAKSLNL